MARHETGKHSSGGNVQVRVAWIGAIGLIAAVAVGALITAIVRPPQPGQPELPLTSAPSDTTPTAPGNGTATTTELAATTPTQVLTSTLDPTSVPPGLFDGNWINEYPDSKRIRRVEIAREGDQLTVRVFGNGDCGAADCLWGTDTVSTADIEGEAFNFEWEKGTAATKGQIQALDDGRLEIKTQTHFSDNSRRDGGGTFFFKRH